MLSWVRGARVVRAQALPVAVLLAAGAGLVPGAVPVPGAGSAPGRQVADDAALGSGCGGSGTTVTCTWSTPGMTTFTVPASDLAARTLAFTIDGAGSGNADHRGGRVSGSFVDGGGAATLAQGQQLKVFVGAAASGSSGGRGGSGLWDGGDPFGMFVLSLWCFCAAFWRANRSN